MGILTCEGCGVKTAAVRNSIMVGQAMTDTGFSYGTCGYTDKAIWLCPVCTAKAKQLAEQLFAITKTPYYYAAYLIDHDVRETWQQEQQIMAKEHPNKYDFTELHEHPEGGERGGYAPETHTFLIYKDGRVEHDYSLDCDGPEGFGFDTLQRLTTKEDALGFVDQEINALKQKLALYEKCRAELMAAEQYKDVADYSEYDDEDLDEDDSDDGEWSGE